MGRKPDGERRGNEGPELPGEQLEEIERQAEWARRNLGEQEWARFTRRVVFAERCMTISALATIVGALGALVGGLYVVGHWGLDRLGRDLPGATDSLTAGAILWRPFLLPALILGLAAVLVLLGLAIGRATDRRWHAQVGSSPDAEEARLSAYFVILDRARTAHQAAKAAAAEREVRQETKVRTRSWLATELDGAHLVWWISFVVLTSDWLLGGVLPQPVALVVWAVAGMGIVLKVAILPILVVCSWIWPHARHLNPRVYYRTLGDGWQYVVIALAPALLALVFQLELHTRAWLYPYPK